jgi:hypothetical protein
MRPSLQQKYTLSAAQRNALRQEQHNLGLKDDDITPIEARIQAEIQAYQQKLQQYEQVLTQSMQNEYPLGEEIREELRRFQAVLELGDDDVTAIEAKIVSQMATVHQSARHEIKVPPEEKALPPGLPQENIEKVSATGVRPHAALVNTVAAPGRATPTEVIDVTDVLEDYRLGRWSICGGILTFGGVIGIAAAAPLGYLIFLVGLSIMGCALVRKQRRQWRARRDEAPP